MIVDSKGRSFKQADLQLQTEQNAQTAMIAQEFALHPSRGLTPARLAKIFENAETGYLVDQFDLYEDMEEKDGHIASEMGKRKRAIIGLD